MQFADGIGGSSLSLTGSRVRAAPVEEVAPEVVEEPHLAQGTPASMRANIANARGRTPKGCVRAKTWSNEVEEAYRFQCAGWKSMDEYLTKYPEPDRYPESALVAKLQLKSNGYFMYFRNARECADKYVPRVKVYTY